MEIKTYFDKLTEVYRHDFDMITPVEIGGKKYLGYGHFYGKSARYVLVKRATLWTAEAFEHVVFMAGGEDLEADFAEARHLIENHMEENYVRNGNKYPEKDHMYSFLTVVILTNLTFGGIIREKVNKYKFTKNYMFTVRGYSEGRIIMVNVENQDILLSRAAKKMEKFFKTIFS
ncbi:MAG: hypothetical protein LBQ97_08865 [Fusobacteriaceae bacterium]|nr:hypothetical protein [Fusobacteriaceae bacterium]